VKPLHDELGVKKGLMTTIHAYTNDQKLTDVYHPDMRRARSATQSMIPTKTGAAAAVGLVLPELAGKLDGFAVRVPTINVSLVDLTFEAGRETTVEEVNSIVKGNFQIVVRCKITKLILGFLAAENKQHDSGRLLPYISELGSMRGLLASMGETRSIGTAIGSLLIGLYSVVLIQHTTFHTFWLESLKTAEDFYERIGLCKTRSTRHNTGQPFVAPFLPLPNQVYFNKLLQHTHREQQKEFCAALTIQRYWFDHKYMALFHTLQQLINEIMQLFERQRPRKEEMILDDFLGYLYSPKTIRYGSDDIFNVKDESQKQLEYQLCKRYLDKKPYNQLALVQEIIQRYMPK
jgi:hypothetical protein